MTCLNHAVCANDRGRENPGPGSLPRSKAPAVRAAPEIKKLRFIAEFFAERFLCCGWKQVILFDELINFTAVKA